MRTSEEMLFALLRASLHKKDIETSFFVNATEIDWDVCFRLAQKQGVMALAWDGIVKLPTQLQPHQDLKIRWGVKVELCERKYKRYCKVANDITQLYKKHDIATLHLKGVGLSALYPVPSHREGGDIDIYTYSANKNRMTDAEANRMADILMQEKGIKVSTNHTPKHSNFHYKEIPVENHKSFLNVTQYKVAVQGNKILNKCLNPQATELLNGEYTIHTPSSDFNTLFLAFHAAQHYGSGLALHHLCDWAILISRYGLQIPEGFKDKRFFRAVSAFTILCNRHLGTSIKVNEDKWLADEMLKEILFPKFSAEIPVKSKSGILVYKTRRLLHHHRLKSHIFKVSLAKRIWNSFVCHIRNPKTIFQTKVK